MEQKTPLPEQQGGRAHEGARFFVSRVHFHCDISSKIFILF